jgi:hypothetical protein
MGHIRLEALWKEEGIWTEGFRAASAGRRAGWVRKTGAPAAADSVLGRRRSRDDGVGPFLTFALAVVKVVRCLIF